MRSRPTCLAILSNLLNDVNSLFFGILKYVCDIVVKSLRSLSHLLMSSCTCKLYTVPAFTPQPQNITALWLVLILPSHGG